MEALTPLSIFSTIIVVLAFLIGIVTIIVSIRSVQSGTIVLVERHGRYTRQLNPGLNFLTPLVERARWYEWSCLVEGKTKEHKKMLYISRNYVDLRETQLDLPPYTLFTIDRLEASVNCVLYFYISDPHAAVYNLTNLYGAIASIVETTLRSATCTLTLDQAIAGIVPIRTAVTEALAAKQKSWGFTLTNFDLQSIDPPPAVVAATTASIVAARKAEENKRLGAAECEVVEQRALAKKRLNEIENESAAVMARGKAERELMEATQLARCILVKAEATEKAAKMRNETRAGAFKEMRAAGLSDSTIVELDTTKAWRAVAKRQSTTLVVPYESARYLGARTAAMLDA